MNIEDYCLRILTGTKLEDKIAPVKDVVLSSYNKLTKVPDLPGRPQALSFDLAGSMKLPSIHQLDEVRNRGLLLHFFLNHELLALEIMALVMLKFPDLPESFKRTLLQTMRDEQLHASLYIERMKQFGIEPGDMPVNRFFWDCFSSISDPMQFVTGMSLTFEQANLDYSLYYKEAFEEIGDQETASVLQQVYDDEVSHVSHGLKWFRKWKKPNLSDWQEYVSALELPLSPARAKGIIYDRQGRLKAGLDEEFIDNLEVSSFSKGRAPNVYLFDGFSEASIAMGSSFNTPTWGEKLNRDFSVLPLPFAGSDDLLISSAAISTEHLRKLKKCGFDIPQIQSISQWSEISPLKDRHPGHLYPWGWSPAMNEVLQPLIRQQKNTEDFWRDHYKTLFSKEWAVNLQREVSRLEHPLLNGGSFPSEVCRSLDEIQRAFQKILTQGYSTLAVKALFGASGRDIIRFPKGVIDSRQQGRLQNLLKKQRAVIVEPWVERVADFSAHFQIEDKVRFLGLSRLFNTGQGQYNASLFGKVYQNIPAEVMAFLHSCDNKGLSSCFQELLPLLSTQLEGQGYGGPLGIDCFIYRDPSGQLQLRPVVEANFRFTMGRLALHLEKNLAPGKVGLFKIFSLLSSRDKKLASKLVQLQENTFTLNKQGRWLSGVCQLNEWSDELCFPVFIAVGRDIQECTQQLFLDDI